MIINEFFQLFFSLTGISLSLEKGLLGKPGWLLDVSWMKLWQNYCLSRHLILLKSLCPRGDTWCMERLQSSLPGARCLRGVFDTGRQGIYAMPHQAVFQRRWIETRQIRFHVSCDRGECGSLTLAWGNCFDEGWNRRKMIGCSSFSSGLIVLVIRRSIVSCFGRRGTDNQRSNTICSRPQVCSLLAGCAAHPGQQLWCRTQEQGSKGWP